MPPSLPLLVTDTNIWIDLHVAGLVEPVFRLPYRFLASDFVLASELRQPPVATLRALGLELVELDPLQVTELFGLRAEYGRLSVQDLGAFLVARTRHAVLLTGDRRLGDLAVANGITVHGVLWLLDELVAGYIVPSTEAAEALARMLQGGARLPAGACRERLRNWRSN